ncbi:MAG: hypothetical protein Q7T26_10630 [Dehalococcoidia bacterium]|nr:hypothetical protein [Dehalococcoidia bacterium]
MPPIKWFQMLVGSAVAAITNYMALAVAGSTGKLPLLSAALGGLTYITAYLQNPEKPPAVPEKFTAGGWPAGEEPTKKVLVLPEIPKPKEG